MVIENKAVAMATAEGLLKKLRRTKKFTDDMMETPLKRCLTTFDITLLGIGHMVGAGLYVLTGTVARDMAGPSIVISFIIAGFVSFLSALCYAEFGARIPRAGSAYVYTYMTMGEFWAFVIGWNILLEHIIAGASVARAFSGYLDTLFDSAIRNATITSLGGIHQEYLSDYPDFLAAAIIIVPTVILSCGAKVTTYMNTIFTTINMFVITFVIILGFCYADPKNWTGGDGFAPFGVSGIISGAATCFYAYVGFDSIATASEEAKDPHKSIPRATMISMVFVAVGYILVSAALTLMVPYDKIVPNAAYPEAFLYNGVYWAKYVVSIGALAGMSTALCGSLFTLPRAVYAMASDGLLFAFLAKVNETTRVPVITMVIGGFITAILAIIMDIQKLVEFMSIGTLMAYTIVSASVVILRYKPAALTDLETHEEEDPGGILRPQFSYLETYIGRWCPGTVVTFCVFQFALLSMLLFFVIQLLTDELLDGVWWSILLVILLSVSLIGGVILICIHQKNKLQLSFAVPFVPFVPLASIFFNIGLMMHLNPMTWVRFVIWLSIGFLVYFMYGIHNSHEGDHKAMLLTSKEEKTWGATKETEQQPQQPEEQQQQQQQQQPRSPM